jgi:hypothetical protein
MALQTLCTHDEKMQSNVHYLRISATWVAEKNSVVHAYGRSKSMIGQRRIQIEQKLERVQNAIAQFEQQVLSQSVPNVEYSSELHSLSPIVRAFVVENQQRLRSELEYKRKVLILDATDHGLIQAFFDLKPTKGQVIIQQIRFFSLKLTLNALILVLDSFSQAYYGE